MGTNTQIRTQAKGRNRNSPKEEQPHLPKTGPGRHLNNGRPAALRRTKRLPLNILFFLFSNEIHVIDMIVDGRKTSMADV
ncbi:MAG: hypothetical protein PVF83_10730 [Anaerolineales bacterium]|jgi:hypothetical protein